MSAQARVVLDESRTPGARRSGGTGSSVINFLASIIFSTIIIIGLFDGRKGLSLLAMYRPTSKRERNPPTIADDHAAE